MLEYTWRDASVEMPTAADFASLNGDNRVVGGFVYCVIVKNDGSVDAAGRISVAQVQADVDDPDNADVFWTTPFEAGPFDSPFDPNATPHLWVDADVTLPTAADAGQLWDSDRTDYVQYVLKELDGTIESKHTSTVHEIVNSKLPNANVEKLYWATPIAEGPVTNPPAPVLVPGDFNLNMQIYIIEEVLNGVPTILPHWDFPSESAAQGYIDTFGAGRDLRIIHFVKVRDSKRDKVPAGTPTVWICQKTNTDGSLSYMGNPHLQQSSADFWTGIYGGPNSTYKTKMLAEYPF